MSDSLNNFFNSMGGKIGNPSSQKKHNTNSSGPIRAPFLTPKTLLSSVYTNTNPSSYQSKSTKNGVSDSISDSISSSYTSGNGVDRNSQLIEDRSKSFNGTTYDRKRLQKIGFTPINYYKSTNGEYNVDIPKTLKGSNDKLNENIDSYIEYGDKRHSDFRFSLREYSDFISNRNTIESWDGGNGNNPWESGVDQNPHKLNQYIGTPYDNEDPVYFGFEIILNVQTSPLLNGELESFIEQFGGNYSEIESRKLIVNQFKNELFRYFKLSSGVGVNEGFDPANNIISNDTIGLGYSDPNIKRYYVKKIGGLDKLVESNTMDNLKSFIDYGKDNLTISFFEDTTLNIGTLASLYKLIYWSKLRGKNIIPENLLKFDCEIIISELRDFIRYKKSNNTTNMIEYLKANLSRYRYQLFECQFWFNKMTHPDSIDMSSIELTNNYDIEMSFKYSNLIFERYDPSSLSYRRLRNGTINPLASRESIDQSNKEYIYPESFKDGEVFLGDINNLSISSETSNIQNTSTFNNLENNSKTNIYNLSKSKEPTSANNKPGKNIYENNYKPKENKEGKKTDIYGKASEKLLENIKKAALNEAQRKMNDQFRLLNNSLDNIRNSFGIGRMTQPTNVYNNPPGGQFFFDVQNSLRGFAGDSLSGLIGGG